MQLYNNVITSKTYIIGAGLFKDLFNMEYCDVVIPAINYNMDLEWIIENKNMTLEENNLYIFEDEDEIVVDLFGTSNFNINRSIESIKLEMFFSNKATISQDMVDWVNIRDELSHIDFSFDVDELWDSLNDLKGIECKKNIEYLEVSKLRNIDRQLKILLPNLTSEIM